MKTSKIIIVLLLLFSTTIIAQSKWQIDTLKLTDLRSTDIPLFSTKEILFETLGVPESIKEISISICDSMVGFKKKLSKMKANHLYYINKQIQYIEVNNKIRLVSIDFELNNSVKIEAQQICFSRNLKLKEMLKIFNLSFKKDVTIIKEPFPPPWNYANNNMEKAYRISFSTGESNCTILEFYFDNRKKLRYIHIDSYYFDTMLHDN
jgi:hypothetical protein